MTLTPIKQLWKYLSENTNYFLAHDITTKFEDIEKKYFDTILNELYEECKHGDEEHQQWLKDKFKDFYERKIK